MHNLILRVSKLLILLLIFASASTAQASENHRQQIAELIKSEQEPAGVVFEIVSGDKHYLDWAIPETQRLSTQLREKFPGLDIAVVSHGAEQFALRKESLQKNRGLKSKVQSLVSKDIELHVCGTLAEWRNVSDTEFSSLVDVAPTGPSQINNYISLGYQKIVVRKN